MWRRASVELFDAASLFVSGKDDADMVWASTLAGSSDFPAASCRLAGKDVGSPIRGASGRLGFWLVIRVAPRP